MTAADVARFDGAAGRPRSAAVWIRPERVKELSLLGVILVALVVFGFLVDGCLSGRFFNRVTSSTSSPWCCWAA